MNRVYQKIGDFLPYPFKLGLKYLGGAIPLPIRYGPAFTRTLKFLKRSQWWSKKELEEYQMRQLRRLLDHSFENVPYYRRNFQERGLKPQDIHTLGDLKKLPFTTKQIFQNNLEDLTAKNIPRAKLLKVTTGGSIGIPLTFFEEKRLGYTREAAFMTAQWERVGYRLGDKRAVFRGEIIPRSKENIFWKYDPLNKALLMSSFHLREENLSRYLIKLREFKPVFIHGYPSAISILAKYMKDRGSGLSVPLKAILCGSETIYDWQRKLFRDVFQCRVFSWYGHSEKVLLGGECEQSTYYHFFPEYGYLELIDKNGDSIAEEGAIGELVGTGFNNYATPFIRYRTGDLGVYTSKRCACGRNYPLLKRVEGRLQDFFMARSGTPINLTSLIFAQHFQALTQIKEFQIEQGGEASITVRIVKSDNYTRKDEAEIRTNLSNSLGEGVEIIFEYVKTIPRTKRGKYRFFIQRSNSGENGG